MRRADSLTVFMCPLSCNPVASTSGNPKGPVQGLVYLEVSPKVRLNDKVVGCIAVGKTQSMIGLLCSVLTVMGHGF